MVRKRRGLAVTRQPQREVQQETEALCNLMPVKEHKEGQRESRTCPGPMPMPALTEHEKKKRIHSEQQQGKALGLAAVTLTQGGCTEVLRDLSRSECLAQRPQSSLPCHFSPLFYVCRKLLAATE